MAYIPNSGSVVAFQSDPTKLVATVSVVSLQGASISGTVNVGNFPTTQNVSGSVAAFQGTNPWIITGSVQGSFTAAANQSVSGTVQTDIRGSVAAVIIGGSIAASFTPPANQSVSGAVSVSNFPTTQNVSGSVVAMQGTSPWVITSSIAGGILPISGSVAATITNTNVNVSGSVAAWLQSTNASVITVGTAAANQSVSGTVGASIIGQLPAGTAMLGSVAAYQGAIPWTINSVYGNVSGSVVAFQGAGWSGSVAAIIIGTPVVIPQFSSILAVPVGSVVTVWQSPSIVGTYAEDAAHTTADKGLFVLAVRNDTVASTASADLDYTIHGVDSAGRSLGKPFAPDESRLDTVSSTVSTSVTALFASVTGLRNYVTDVMVANTGSVATLITFRDGSTSILGFTIAPAGGGSNINGMAFPMRTAPGQDFVYVNAVASSVLYVTAKGYKAP